MDEVRTDYLTLTANRMEPMTIGAVGTIWSSVAGVSFPAQMFPMSSVGPSSRAMIRPWKLGFSYSSQLEKRRIIKNVTYYTHILLLDKVKENHGHTSGENLVQC